MFQQRQLNEIFPLIEVSFSATGTPGALTTGTAGRVTVACFVGGPGAANTSPATFALGDDLEVVVPATAGNMAGMIVSATPSATPGTCTIAFQNASAGTITPTTAQYTIVAKRLTNLVV
jgi:hypothetical protein